MSLDAFLLMPDRWRPARLPVGLPCPVSIPPPIRLLSEQASNLFTGCARQRSLARSSPCARAYARAIACAPAPVRPRLRARARAPPQVREQIRALRDIKAMAAGYGDDVSGPARDGRQAAQWMYYGFLAAAKEQVKGEGKERERKGEGG